MTATQPLVRRLLALLYLVGAVILADQAADVLSTLLAQPLQWGAPAWRFGVFGILASRTSVLLVADLMLFVAAIGLEHRKVLRVLGVLHLVLAAAILAGLCLFVLDTVQVRGMVRAGGGRAYAAAAVRAGLVAVLGGILLAWAGFVSFRAAGTGRRSSASEETPFILAARPRKEEGR